MRHVGSRENYLGKPIARSARRKTATNVQQVIGGRTAARLGNAFYWAFSGVAGVLLLFAAVLVLSATPDRHVLLFASVRFVIPASLTWLFGHACHYVLGGDASALWERALIARARRSREFRIFCSTIALLIVSDVVFVILDAQRQEAPRQQQYDQQRPTDERRDAQREEAQRQAEGREAAQRKAAQQEEVQRVPDTRPLPHATPSAHQGPPAGARSADVMTSALAPSPLGGSFAPGDLGVTVGTGATVPCAPSCAVARPVRISPSRASQIVRRKEAQRQAAIAAQQAAAGREAAAERASVISAADLSFSNVTLRPRLTGADAFGRPLTQDQMDELQILSGTITNHSGQTLRNLEFEVTLKDCPVGYGPDRCQVVAQQSIHPVVDILPNQTRTFSEILGFGQLPHRDPQHQRAFSWRIVAASSCSQENLSAHRCANKTAAQ